MLSVKVNTLSCRIWPGESQIGLNPGADPKSQHPGITSVVIYSFTWLFHFRQKYLAPIVLMTDVTPL